ncbi:MAG: GNAT family N-acetyltransferase [Candidatus Fermentibacteraceae bacterium]|nr:GNAT family N-acetyltransferase [Candidatus Fermentibacteraceae bacterium]MBN2608209.1 GNAT family N-acetyltransferase [Candidatus Fermentibacteraceae bacterium]
MDEMIIRKACPGDIKAIAEISRLTWEGDDYLEGKAPGWISDGTLHVGEYRGSVLGTFRMSPMPCGVIWLEALRVHPDHRGAGMGRRLAGEAFDIGREMIRRGPFRCMEFSTYINNHESIHISVSQGFRPVNRFILMTRDGIGSCGEALAAEPSGTDFTEAVGHIPCGWKYPRLSGEGIEWALRKCDAFRYREVVFLRRKSSDETTPISGSRSDPGGFLEGAEAAASARGEKHCCIVVHESRGDIVDEARRRGYGTWEPVEGYNILVYRYEP